MKRLFQLFMVVTLLTVFTGCADNAFEEIDLTVGEHAKGEADVTETDGGGSIPPGSGN